MKAENVIGPVTIEHRPRRSSLGIRLETPFEGMFARATTELKTLRKFVRERLPNEPGPYFLRYYHCDMKSTMEIEVGFLTETILPDTGDYCPGFFPEGRYATLVYRGNGLRANQAMMQWARDHGIRFESIDPTLSESYTCRYEAYLTDYRVESRKLLWDVELSLKLAQG